MRPRISGGWQQSEMSSDMCESLLLLWRSEHWAPQAATHACKQSGGSHFPAPHLGNETVITELRYLTPHNIAGSQSNEEESAAFCRSVPASDRWQLEGVRVLDWSQTKPPNAGAKLQLPRSGSSQGTRADAEEAQLTRAGTEVDQGLGSLWLQEVAATLRASLQEARKLRPQLVLT